jgi:hypothetical protein
MPALLNLTLAVEQSIRLSAAKPKFRMGIDTLRFLAVN